MQTLRYKFGKTLTHPLDRPVIEGELSDVEPTVTLAVGPGDPGLMNASLTFVMPHYDPATELPPSEVHVVAYGPGHGIPLDPKVAIDPGGTLPHVYKTLPAAPAGSTTVLDLVGLVALPTTFKTVIGYLDPEVPPTAPEPAPTPSV